VENADGTSKRSGVELSLRGRLSEQLTLTASYSYVDSEDPADEDELRRPRHSGSLNLNYSFAADRGQVNLRIDYTGDQDDLFFGTFPSTRVVLDNYTLVNVSSSYQISDNINVYGRLENLLDEDYQEVFGYATAGIGAFVGVKVSF
jgi:vitamin B12 transporter